MQEIKLAYLKFRNWNDISSNFTPVSTWWGKTYFYYDKASGKLYAENLSIVGRLLRKCFGYKKEFNRTNLWECLKEKHLVAETDLPDTGKFRTIVATALKQTTKKLDNLADRPEDYLDEEDFQQLFTDKVIDVNEPLTYISEGIGGLRLSYNSPLLLAIRARCTDLALKILKQVKDPLIGTTFEFESRQTSTGATPLEAAIDTQNLALFHNILEKCDKTKIDPTALLGRAVEAKDDQARSRGDVSVNLYMVEKLLALKADPNKVYRGEHVTPLSYALNLYMGENSEPADKKIIKLLLDAGAKPTLNDLYLALGSHQYLPRDHRLRETIHKKYFTEPEIITWLLDKGAQPTMECLWAALDQEYYKESNRYPGNPAVFQAIFNHLKPTKEQIDKNYEKEYTYAYENYLIKKAFWKGPLEACELLLDNGADTSIKDYKNHHLFKAFIYYSGIKFTEVDKAKLNILFNLNLPTDDSDLMQFLYRMDLKSFSQSDAELINKFLSRVKVDEKLIHNALKKIYENSYHALYYSIFSKLISTLPVFNTKNEYADSIVINAIRWGDVGTVQALISRGLNPTQPFAIKWSFDPKLNKPTSPLEYALALSKISDKDKERLQPILALLQPAPGAV